MLLFLLYFLIIAFTNRNKTRKKIIDEIIEEEDEEKNGGNKNIYKIKDIGNSIENSKIKENNKSKEKSKSLDNSKSKDISKSKENIKNNDDEESNNNANYNEVDSINVDRNILSNENRENIIDNSKKRFEKGINLLLKNKLDLNEKIYENKNILININWKHSSNKKLNSYRNERNDNILYKNKFLKNTPKKDKLIKGSDTKEKGIFLPYIKTPNSKKEILNLNDKSVNANNNENILSRYIKIPTESLSNYFTQKNEFCENKKLYRNAKLNKIINNNNINDTQTTQSATNNTKIQNSNIIPSLKDNLNQNEVGLITGSTTINNNILIPLITKKRPVSNLKSNENIPHNISENEHKGRNGNNFYINLNRQLSQDIRNYQSQEPKKKISISIKKKEPLNIFPEVKRLMPNFHKIKIEKGLINKLTDSYSNRISYDYKTKNSINFSENI